MYLVRFTASVCVAAIIMSKVLCRVPKMPSWKYMLQIHEMIQENRTTLETVYMKNATRLHNSTLKMKEQVNNTITVSVDTLKDIASVIDLAAEYVQDIEPNHAGSIEKFVKEKQNIVEFGNDTICSVFHPHYIAAEKLSRNVSRLLKIIEINTNQARKINLELCLIEPTKPLRISCLRNIMKTYARYLIRVRNALKTYNEFNNSIQRKIDNATRTTVIHTFQKAHSSARTVVKHVFESAEVTPDAITRHTQQKVTNCTKAIRSYIPQINGKLKLVKDAYDSFFEEYENYKTVFNNLKNLASLAVDIIVYSKNVTAPELEYVKEKLNIHSTEYFNKLVEYYNGLKYKIQFIQKQIWLIDEKFRQSKPVNISCTDSASDIAYLFDCLNEKISYHTQIINTTKIVYNNSKALAENILENSDIYNRKVYDEFSLDVYNLTLNLIKDYDVGAADIISYEQTVVQTKYNDTLSAINKISEKYTDEFFEELETKVTVMNTINDIIDKVIIVSRYYYSCHDDENVARAKDMLTKLNETIANQYDNGSSNILNKIGNATENSAECKMNDVITSMNEERLAEKCSMGNSSSMNVVKVAHALQCVEREQTKFNHSMSAVTGDYATLISELEEMNALFMHDIQAALKNGIRNILPAIGGNHPGYGVLTCLNKVDIRKANSGQLETEFEHCSSVLSERGFG